jgi:2-dehydropantoate 2-reductase
VRHTEDPLDTGFAAGRTVEISGDVDPAGESAGGRSTVAVVGAGAVGGYFAARAAGAGADVTVCTRRPFERLCVVHSDAAGGGEAVSEPPTRIVSTVGELDGPAEWVLLATKVHQTAGALPWLERLVGPRTVVVVAQNGVRHVGRVSPPVPPEQVLPAAVYINAELVAPGTVRHRAYGFMQLPDVEAAERLASRVFGGGGEVRLVDDFATASWTKLTINCAANSLTALTGRRLEVLRRDDVADVALALMREAVAVAHADGAQVAADLPDVTVRRLRGQPPGAGTSMYYDRAAGRRLEHDALLGAVVRIGAEHGVPTPVSCVVSALLSAIDESGGDRA